MLRYLLGGFAAICLFMIAKSVIEHAPQPAAAGFADGQQNVVTAPMPTGSTTPDLNATAAASGKSTMDAANTATGNERATQAEGTRMASTQTPMAWTAQAADAQRQQAEAEREKVLAEVQILAGTITAAPTSEWKTEVAYFPTMKAEQAKAKAQATIDERERVQAAEIDDATHKATLALIIVGTIIILGGLAWVVVALSWRVQGVSGGQAQASVVAAARTVPVTENKKTREVVMDADRAQLIRFVDMCRSLSGDDATTITPQNDERIRSKEWWRQCVKALGELDLVDASQGSGHGTAIKHNRTLADLADVLRKGSEG